MVSEGRDLVDEDRHGPQTQLLACPFSKLDGNRYYGCLKFELRRMKDVKQHISRKHLSPEFYCPRCWQTFPDRGKRDEHARVVSCANQTKPFFLGVSDEQRDQLKRSTGRGATTEKQWYDVWQILFQDKPKPSSVYRGNFMEETLSYFRTRCQKEDFETILSNLGKRRSEVVDARLIRDVVDVVLDWFFVIIDNPPAVCEFGPVEMDIFSHSDTSSPSAPILDFDFQHDGLNLEWPWPLDFPSLHVDGLESVGSEIPEIP